jgi:hypothetical protein
MRENKTVDEKSNRVYKMYSPHLVASRHECHFIVHQLPRPPHVQRFDDGQSYLVDVVVVFIVSIRAMHAVKLTRFVEFQTNKKKYFSKTRGRN